MKLLVERDSRGAGTVVDRKFIAEHTSGWDEFVGNLDRSTWEEIVASSGVERAMIEKLAASSPAAKRMIILWCLGLSSTRTASITLSRW